MRTVARQAVANSRLVHGALDLSCIFIAVAGETELIRSSGDQLDTGYVAVDPNFVAAQASGGDRRMDRFTRCLVLMALNTGR